MICVPTGTWFLFTLCRWPRSKRTFISIISSCVLTWSHFILLGHGCPPCCDNRWWCDDNNFPPSFFAVRKMPTKWGGSEKRYRFLRGSWIKNYECTFRPPFVNQDTNTYEFLSLFNQTRFFSRMFTSPPLTMTTSTWPSLIWRGDSRFVSHICLVGLPTARPLCCIYLDEEFSNSGEKPWFMQLYERVAWLQGYYCIESLYLFFHHYRDCPNCVLHFHEWFAETLGTALIFQFRSDCRKDSGETALGTAAATAFHSFANRQNMSAPSPS